jgi:hypothetical protein
MAAVELGGPLTALGRGGDEERVLGERVLRKVGVRRLQLLGDP